MYYLSAKTSSPYVSKKTKIGRSVPTQSSSHELWMSALKNGISSKSFINLWFWLVNYFCAIKKWCHNWSIVWFCKTPVFMVTCLIQYIKKTTASCSAIIDVPNVSISLLARDSEHCVNPSSNKVSWKCWNWLKPP